MRLHSALRPSVVARQWMLSRWIVAPPQRSVQHQAYDASFDPDELDAARRWHSSFSLQNIPEGSTSFSRSSGPGGQHVNKTETKATTTWSVRQLLGFLPKLLHAGIRQSKYYSKRSDCLTIQAQTQRSRSANEDENRQKLFDELEALYRMTVPGESSPEKAKKYEALKKSANEARVKAKKQHSSKKAFRKGSDD